MTIANAHPADAVLASRHVATTVACQPLDASVGWDDADVRTTVAATPEELGLMNVSHSTRRGWTWPAGSTPLGRKPAVGQ